MQHRGTTWRTRGIAGLVALLGFVGAANAAPVSAGTSISNTANASYVDSATGLNVRLVSNTVATIVQPLEALLLTANQSVGSSPSNGFVLPHQLLNTGNLQTTYVLSLNAAGGGFAPAGLQIVQDSNSNGVADPGEPVIASGGTVTLAQGAVANLLLVGTIPLSASAGQSAQGSRLWPIADPCAGHAGGPSTERRDQERERRSGPRRHRQVALPHKCAR